MKKITSKPTTKRDHRWRSPYMKGAMNNELQILVGYLHVVSYKDNLE